MRQYGRHLQEPILKIVPAMSWPASLIGVTPQFSAPGVTIPSDATAVYSSSMNTRPIGEADGTGFQIFIFR